MYSNLVVTSGYLALVASLKNSLTVSTGGPLATRIRSSPAIFAGASALASWAGAAPGATQAASSKVALVTPVACRNARRDN